MRLIIGCVNLTELLRTEMAEGATSDGPEHTTSLASTETEKQPHAITLDAGGKNPALVERLADKQQAIGECLEHQVIRNNLDRVTRSISSDSSAGPIWFAQKLEEKAFIANAASAVVMGCSSYDQTSKLMDAVKGKIGTSQEPAKEFEKFLEILKRTPPLVDLARELRMEYGKPPEKPLSNPDMKTSKQMVPISSSSSSESDIRPKQACPVVTIAVRNKQMITTKFASLVKRASNKLQIKGISVEDLLLFLETAYLSEDSNNGCEFVAAITGSPPTIGEIFRAIGRQGLWSYWNFYLLQSLVETFVNDDDDLQADIKQYKEELTGFILTTEIEPFLETFRPSTDPDQLPSPCPDPKLFSLLSLKLDRDVTDRSLEYIRQVWESLGKKCRLPLHTILLQRFGLGSICIHFMIPFHLMPQLVRGLCESAAYFKEQHMLWVSVDGVYLYKEPGVQLSEFPSEELETIHSVRKTALFAAAEHGNTESVDLLLSQSLNPNMLNKKNETALDVAVEHEQWEVVELLEGKGAMSGEGMPEMMASGGKDLKETTAQPQVVQQTHKVTTTPPSQEAKGNYPTGYECEFVEPSPDILETRCSICLHIPREPHQVSCCGQHFCKSCIEHTQSENKPCPLCNQPDFTATLDRGMQRHLNDLKVYCTHKEQGCEWVGELRHLDHHLNANPKSGEELTGCEFVEVNCSHGCGGRFQRRYLAEHHNNCPSRPFSCEYCSHSSTYQDVVDNHWPLCPQYPLQCPNSCEDSPIERQHLEQHINEECPLGKVNCELQFAGCTAQVQRRDMAAHVKDNLPKHLSQLSSTTRILVNDIRCEIKQEFVQQTTSQQKAEGMVKREQAEVKEDLERQLQELKEKINTSDNTQRQLQTTVEHAKTTLKISQYGQIVAATILALVGVYVAVGIMQHQPMQQQREDLIEAPERIQQLRQELIEATERIRQLRQGHIEATERIQQLQQDHIEATERIRQLRQGHNDTTETLHQQIQHLQYQLHVAPTIVSPSRCTANGPGLYLPTENATTEVTVSVVNMLGIAYSGERVNVTAELETDGIFTQANVSCIATSKYRVTYRPIVCGWNRLYVKVNSSDIKGSPFNIFVSPEHPQEIGGLKSPWDIAVNSHGEIFVTEFTGHQISVFNTDREKIRTIGSRGTGDGKFRFPAGIDIDADDNVYVASEYKLQKFTRKFEQVKSVSISKEIRGVKVHDDKVYVCDLDNHQILEYGLELKFIRKFGNGGTGKGVFDRPYDIAVDAKGNIHVVDFGNNRVQVLNEDGQFLREIGRENEENEENEENDSDTEKLKYPRAIHIAGDYVYVADWSRDHMVVFRTSGEFVTTRGEKLGRVQGITTDSNGRLYVCDHTKHHCKVL